MYLFCYLCRTSPQHVHTCKDKFIQKFDKYCKIASCNTFCLEPHAGFFRLLVKGDFWSLLVTHVRTRNYTAVWCWWNKLLFHVITNLYLISRFLVVIKVFAVSVAFKYLQCSQYLTRFNDYASQIPYFVINIYVSNSIFSAEKWRSIAHSNF